MHHIGAFGLLLISMRSARDFRQSFGINEEFDTARCPWQPFDKAGCLERSWGHDLGCVLIYGCPPAAILVVLLFITKFLRDCPGRRNNFTVQAPNPRRWVGAWAITKSDTEWKERRDQIERYRTLEQ